MTKDANEIIADELERRTSSLGVTEEEARAGKKFVRTFLFSMAIGSPLAKMHVITRVILAVTTSIIALMMIRTTKLDPIGILLITGFTIMLMYLSGVFSWVARTYIFVIPIATTSIAMSWVLFNPAPGNVILVNFQVYSGIFRLDLGLWHLAFFAIAVPIYFKQKNFTHSFIFGFIAGWLVHFFLPAASIRIFSFPLFSE